MDKIDNIWSAVTTLLICSGMFSGGWAMHRVLDPVPALPGEVRWHAEAPPVEACVIVVKDGRSRYPMIDPEVIRIERWYAADKLPDGSHWAYCPSVMPTIERTPAQKTGLSIQSGGALTFGPAGNVFYDDKTHCEIRCSAP